ncbi:hypothetical protein VKT23_004126 [Stygiomarasmius scandens]|uniref:Protein N-terminal glutamine amidohydrolase n=1 Tax=Marasmiellus scandens TaxID=2682957 RepID=A0ABR1JTT5_9AGAR
MVQPPPLPQDSVYTSCYCEENIYLLVKTFLDDPSITSSWEPFVIFISNATQSIALWNQKLSKTNELPVVWDYHVILVLRPRALSTEMSSWVYDYDTRLGMPISLKDYFARTFSLDLPVQFQSFFRVVPGPVYIDNLASDRSHMLSSGTIPPEYPPLRGMRAIELGITHNLTHYISMAPAADQNIYGRVMYLYEILSSFI